MVGADESDAPQIASWSGSAIKAFNDVPEEWAEVNAALNALAAYVLDLIKQKRRNRAEDLTSGLLAAADDSIIDPQDVVSLLLEILAASSDNSSHSTSIMVSLLCRYPDQWRALTQDNSLIASAVEETMRFMPRVQCGMHFNPAAVDWGGLHFPAKTRFYLHIAVANRDPAVYQDPDRLDVRRRPARPQLGFGMGRHLCLGLSLARMELQEVLRVMLEKWRMLTFAGEPEYKVMDDVAIVRMPVSFQRNVMS
jgi:cytochrome P450